MHHAYLAEVAFRRVGRGRERRLPGDLLADAKPARRKRAADDPDRGLALGHAIGRALARAAGVEDPEIRWRFCEGPWFNNQVATLKIDGREASMRLDKTVATDGEEFELERVFDHPLTGGSVPGSVADAERAAAAT